MFILSSADVEFDSATTRVTIPTLGAELALPPELSEAKLIGMALAELLGSSDTSFPVKQIPIQKTVSSLTQEADLDQSQWIHDLASSLMPKSEALTSSKTKPDEKVWEQKVAEALNSKPPKTLVLDFEDIEPIHWQEFDSDTTLSINSLISIRNILQFLQQIQKFSEYDSENIKFQIKLHFNTQAAINLQASAHPEILASFTQRSELAKHQFLELFKILADKLGINLPFEVESDSEIHEDKASTADQIAKFWQFTTKAHAVYCGSDPTGNKPLETWKLNRALFKSKNQIIIGFSNFNGYDVELANLLDIPEYKSQFEATPGTDFFGHLTPQFKFDLLSRIALTQGMTGLTYSELMANQTLVTIAINWLADIILRKKAQNADQTLRQDTEVHFSYRLTPDLVDEAAALIKNISGPDAYIKKGLVAFKPLAGLSDMTTLTVPEFVRYQEPDVTTNEMLAVIRASLPKKIQSQLVGGNEALAELLLKFANAKLTVRGTADSTYPTRPGKTFTAQISFPENPKIIIPVKIRVAQKKDA